MTENSTDEIVSALFSAFTILKTRLSFKATFFQLPMAQMETLRLIAEKKQVQMKEVASFLSITPPSATVLIGNLVKAGYVKRHSDKHDRRTIHLSLTETGSAVLQKGVKDRCRDLKKLIGNLSGKEQVELLEILKKMIRNNN
jgi:DNA-binding MarR family transcriptional regulator